MMTLITILRAATRPRIHGIMLGLMFRAVWLTVYGLVRTPPVLGLALFFIFFSSALVDTWFMSILQLKMPPPTFKAVSLPCSHAADRPIGRQRARTGSGYRGLD